MTKTGADFMTTLFTQKSLVQQIKKAIKAKGSDVFIITHHKGQYQITDSHFMVNVPSSYMDNDHDLKAEITKIFGGIPEENSGYRLNKGAKNVQKIEQDQAARFYDIMHEGLSKTKTHCTFTGLKFDKQYKNIVNRLITVNIFQSAGNYIYIDSSLLECVNLFSATIEADNTSGTKYPALYITESPESEFSFMVLPIRVESGDHEALSYLKEL